ncbi:TPA: phytoene/squalene synthase family protein [bacterium]|nr:phytoene/squalene synthase family protein [bacterium]
MMRYEYAKTNIYSWENELINYANKAIESHIDSEPIEFDKEILNKAYRHCGSVTRFHSKTFYMASELLPFDKRRSVRALYAFCRVCDDLIDCTKDDPEESLESWRINSLNDKPLKDDLIALAWTDTRIKYNIPKKLAEQLIDGVARDICIKRYETFKQLTEYCYGVASTVGLMAMHIIGFSGIEAIPYAIRLGIALQLNNILRDVGEDWKNGRIYLPQEELKQFGLTEEDFIEGKIDDRWRRFIKFQIERNRRIYAEALPGVRFLNPDGRFAITAAAELYQAILEDIETHNYDVFNRRAFVSTWGKIRRLPNIWWRSKSQYYVNQYNQINRNKKIA